MAREKQQASSNGNGTLALPDAQPSSGSTAIALNQTALLKGDLLADIPSVQFDDDGLTEVGPEDIKLSAKIFNAKILGPNGDPVPPNVFFDTVTEQTARELNAILIKTHKTNEWRTFDEAAGKSIIHCRSFDRITGTMADGTQRQCEGCPDAQWNNIVGKDGKPKRTRNCGPVHNVFSVELETLQPFVIRFRRTSLPVIQQYLSRHHVGRRPMKDATGKIKMGNYPLYAFACKLTLKMTEGRNAYAVPVLERGAVLPPELIQQGAETVAYVNSVLLKELYKVVDAETERTSDADEVDTSFDTDKMGGTGGGEGQDFTS